MYQYACYNLKLEYASPIICNSTLAYNIFTWGGAMQLATEEVLSYRPASHMQRPKIATTRLEFHGLPQPLLWFHMQLIL